MENTSSSRKTFWFDERRKRYMFLPNMTRAEWKEFSHLTRRFKLDTGFVEFGTFSNPNYISVFTIAGSDAVSCGKLYPKKYHNYFGSCRVLYQLHKKAGENEVAHELLVEARNWFETHGKTYAWWIKKGE